jgi:hypothetical protein
LCAYCDSLIKYSRARAGLASGPSTSQRCYPAVHALMISICANAELSPSPQRFPLHTRGCCSSCRACVELVPSPHSCFFPAVSERRYCSAAALASGSAPRCIKRSFSTYSVTCSNSASRSAALCLKSTLQSRMRGKVASFRPGHVTVRWYSHASCFSCRA